MELLGRKGAQNVTGGFFEWLDSLENRPFFAFLNYYDAHIPYLPQAPFDTVFGPKRARHHAMADLLPEAAETGWLVADAEVERDAYDGTIAELDQELGHLFEELERRGLLKNTVVVLTGDHGEEFLEHGMMRHGQNLYRVLVQVPLVVWLPGSPLPGERIAQPVSLRDLPATILDLVGAAPIRLPGRSLVRYWADTLVISAEPLLSSVTHHPGLLTWYPVSQGDLHAMELGRFRYIRRGDGVEELYDLDRDPEEMSNLAADPAFSDWLIELRQSLDSILQRR
jgi:arylsulfatase A-like enzyme